MSARKLLSGWRGASLVAVIYAYFLIFAQFAFLGRLAELSITATTLKGIMAVMAAGGIVFSFLTPRVINRFSPASLLRFGFVVCCSASICTLLPFGTNGEFVVAFIIGAGLGILTVSLVTHLPRWVGSYNPVLMIGVGTGLGYFLCNVPEVFTAAPRYQTLLSILLCATGFILASPGTDITISSKTSAPIALPFPLILIYFVALVWIDSAAFYIIQHTSLLKAGTWVGAGHLWMNGWIHFCAALIAAALLSRSRLTFVLAVAAGLLCFACLLLAHSELILPASLLYPAGVSFYSVALVAYPSIFSGASTLEKRANKAGWLYAIAGWVGSALGIGMAQNLGHIPSIFIAISGLTVAIPVLLEILRVRARELVLLCGTLALGFVVEHIFTFKASGTSFTQAAERGRRVYISEGCMSCHSQYVRPGTPDELMWGPVETMQQIQAQKPPLIGNRRQGPDLMLVGLRRSPLWLKAHLIAPSELSARSIMPSYSFLFNDRRGDDLVAYLASLQMPNRQQLMVQAAWQPNTSAWHEASIQDGAALYYCECATCHDSNGAARIHWRTAFRVKPTDSDALNVQAQTMALPHLAQIIKFGVFGTDMPGHEYLKDRQIVSLILWLTRHSAQPMPSPHS
jgi:cbb3-type cytochrome oxidase cytochrome c subunit